MINLSRKQFLLSVVFFLLTLSLFSQTAEEAIDITRFSPYGTTRALSTMNTLDALGADLNAPSTNPAGLGNFRRSEFIFSTSWEMVEAESSLIIGENGQKTSRSILQIDQLGIVFNLGSPENKDWKQINFGINYQKLDSYQKKFNYSGSSKGSITQSFLEKANGYGKDELDPFYEGLAYDLTLIVDENEIGKYDIDLPNDVEIGKYDSYETLGSKGSTNLSFGANYREKLLIGATVGFPSIDYDINQDYNEDDADDEYEVFSKLNYKREGRTSGQGINGRIGVIYNFNRALRVGFSSQTPTRHKMEVITYTSDLSYDYFFNGRNESFTELSPDQSAEYKLFTPWNHRLSLGSVIGRNGFVSGVVSYTNYSGLRYDFDDTPAENAYEIAQNNRIDSLFSESINLSIGGEYVLSKKLRLRMGIGYETSPFESIQSDILRFSGGIGWRKDDFYFDIGYLNEAMDEVYSPYQTTDYAQTDIDQKITKHRINLTLGFKI